MVGIAGIVSPEKIDKDLFRRMMETISCSATSIEKNHLENCVALGTSTLSRLEYGRLCFSEDRSLCAIMDGEFLDSQHLVGQLTKKKSKFYENNDVEVLLNLYQKIGLDFVHQVKGAYTVVIWDKREKRLILINDRYGLRPLYYAHHRNRFLFSSKVAGILKDSEFNKKIDWSAVGDFFTFQYVMGNKTFVKGISLLPPGSILTFEKGNVYLKHYWDWNYKETYDDLSLDDYVDEGYFLLRQAVKRCMEGEKAIGVPLSGGMDSRAIVGCIESTYLPVPTFTFGFSWSNDVKFAKRNAAEVGTPHHYCPIDPDYLLIFCENGITYTDGMINCIHFHTFNILDKMSKMIDIALDGLGGDVLFGSHLSSDIINCSDKNLILKRLFKKYNSAVPFDHQSHFFSKEFFKEIKEDPFISFAERFSKIGAHESENKFDYLDLKNRQRRFIYYGSLMMRNQVESRYPFFDYDFVDFYLKIPPVFRVNQRLYIEIFRKKLPHLARIPRANTGLPIGVSPSRLQSGLKWRMELLKSFISEKSGGKFKFRNPKEYAAYDIWFRSNLKGFVCNTILGGDNQSMQFFNRGYVENMLDKHFRCKGNYSTQIGCLLTFELWYKHFA
jgi:asparagine synthase (glutamine-hydrolysing)